MTGALLNAGTRTLYVKFKPSDAIDYNSAAASVSIKVVRLQKNRAFYKIVKTFTISNLSDQIGVKITFIGNNNSLKVHKNYFCNGTHKKDQRIV